MDRSLDMDRENMLAKSRHCQIVKADSMDIIFSEHIVKLASSQMRLYCNFYPSILVVQDVFAISTEDLARSQDRDVPNETLGVHIKRKKLILWCCKGAT